MTNGKDIGFGIRSRMQARHLLQVPWKTEPEARLGAASLLGVGEPGLESGGKCSRKGWEKNTKWWCVSGSLLPEDTQV